MKKSNRNLLFAVLLLQLQVLYAQNDTTIKANFDEELGFENASRFISKGALECRIYNTITHKTIITMCGGNV
jgi:hypothetical protein